MDASRFSKIALLGSSAVFFILVVFNNLTDYRSNFLFVENVLNMSTTFEGNSLMWRAIEAPWLHHLFYWSIISWESMTAALLTMGTIALWKARNADAAAFAKAKQVGIAGLTVGMLLWYLAFITVGGEWFLMWQSPIWNGQNAAMRMFLIMGVSLIYLVQKEPAV